MLLHITMAFSSWNGCQCEDMCRSLGKMLTYAAETTTLVPTSAQSSRAGVGGLAMTVLVRRCRRGQDNPAPTQCPIIAGDAKPAPCDSVCTMYLPTTTIYLLVDGMVMGSCYTTESRG